MSPKPVSHIELSPTLLLTEYGANTGSAYRNNTNQASNGFWLYDKTRGVNIAMRAESEHAAFIEALKYYQRRLISREDELRVLTEKVKSFLNQFKTDDDGYEVQS